MTKKPTYQLPGVVKGLASQIGYIESTISRVGRQDIELWFSTRSEEHFLLIINFTFFSPENPVNEKLNTS